MASTIQVRLDDELKTRSDILFKKLGTDTTNAIRMFLVQAVEKNGFPFDIKMDTKNPYTPMNEEELLKKLEISKNHADQGYVRDADDMIKDMRSKYGL
jgi:DNA-damage-inducible protein J